MGHWSEDRYRLWLVGGAFMAAAWFADSVVDVWFTGDSLWRNLFAPTPHEFSIRLVFILFQLGLLLYIRGLFRQRLKLEQQRSAALRQVEIERGKAEAILEAMGDGISIQDLNLKVLYQNAAHRERMGHHLGEFCYSAYQQRDDVCPGCHLIQSFADGQTHVREATASPNGELRHFEIVSTPLFDASGQLIAGIESVRDITDRKRAEEAVYSLADDLQGRTAELEAANRELEAANRELEAFSYSLSHDLRSYLARIILSSEALQVADEERLGPEGRDCLRNIQEACDGMDDLIEAMLTLSRVTRQDLQLEEVDVSALATAICTEQAQAEPARTFTFTIAPGLRARADAQLLHVVLANLIGNACKYTRDQAEACISLAASEQDGYTVFAVADNGIGFDMQEAGKLFLPFQRLSSARRIAGTGIGLTTVQRVVQRHGGRIWAESSPGQGATFYFTLAG